MPDSFAPVSHLRALPPCSVDPFREELRPLSHASLDWLIEHAFLDPQPTSPLAPQATYRVRRPRAEREAAGSELARRGLVSRAWVPDERRTRLVESSVFGRTLAILEDPQQLLRLGLGSPEGVTDEVRLYIAGGRAVVASFESETVWIGSPFSLEGLLTYLTDELDSEPAGHLGDALCLWPTLFRLTTALWPESGRAADHELSADDLAHRLADDSGRDRADSLLAEMVAAEVAEPADSGVVLSRRYRRWLEPVWSGHVFEVEVARLAHCDPAITGRLLFAGPPGPPGSMPGRREPRPPRRRRHPVAVRPVGGPLAARRGPDGLLAALAGRAARAGVGPPRSSATTAPPRRGALSRGPNYLGKHTV